MNANECKERLKVFTPPGSSKAERWKLLLRSENRGRELTSWDDEGGAVGDQTTKIGRMDNIYREGETRPGTRGWGSKTGEARVTQRVLARET